MAQQTPQISAPSGVEANGINIVAEGERKGRPRDLFWPWFGANVSVLAVSYGSFVLGFHLSFWQASIAAVIGVVLSFLACGFVALAGQRGSAPTMVLSRAAFGVVGNKLPSALSWLLMVGWETAIVVLATLATSTVFARLGWPNGGLAKLIILFVIAASVVFIGVVGFDLIMRVQAWITVAAAVLTAGYLVLVASRIDWAAVSAMPSGSFQAVLGALILMATALGLGWVNAAADYSRYLPRSASSAGVVTWTTVGGSLAPVVLVVFGILLAGSSKELSTKIGADPIGALTEFLPTWFLVPFAVVVIISLIAGAVLDIYSSGLALLSIGLPAPRYVAALIDGVIMVVGAILVVFFAGNFIGPFQGFLITLGVPISAWAGVILADVALRRRNYVDADLYDARGRYGGVQPVPIVLVLVGTIIGWGLVTNAYAGWLSWQGYLLGPLGLGGREGGWAYANLGVLCAIAIGFVGHLVLGRRRVQSQESFR
jgi:NCS1 family nucleobase:cation symporter-1